MLVGCGGFVLWLSSVMLSVFLRFWMCCVIVGCVILSLVVVWFRVW